MKEKHITKISTPCSLSESDILNDAHGPVSIPMTNDYLFRAMLQKNNKVLKGLLCSLLHLSPNQIHSAVITNPIDLGTAVDSKTLFLDIRLILNDSTIVNLEMQVINEHNWPERSLTYLCRSFDHLNAGEDYVSAKPAIQIGLLAFTLFPEHPEFYSTYRFLNIKKYTQYSDKLTLSVLDLTKIDLATEEDRAYHIDYWANLFKATTWEEIKMLAQKDEFIKEASSTIYQLSQEENIRLQCEAREDYYRRQRDVEHHIAALDSIIAEKNSVIAEKDSTIAEKDSTIAEKNSTIAEKDSTIAEKDSVIAEKDSVIAEKDSTIAEKDSVIAEKDSTIAEKDSTIAALQAEIELLKSSIT